jgi:Na+/alanine symporter
MCRKLHNMSETSIADRWRYGGSGNLLICLLFCLTLRGWRHILNLCGFLTPTTMVQYFIMTLYIFAIVASINLPKLAYCIHETFWLLVKQSVIEK